MVYAVDERTLTVLDGSTNTITATVGGAGYARTVAVDEATDTVYVADYVGGRVSGDRRGHQYGGDHHPGWERSRSYRGRRQHRQDLRGRLLAGWRSSTGPPTPWSPSLRPFCSPGRVLLNPTTNTLYFVNGPQNVITAVQGSTLTVTGTVQIAGNDYYSYGLVVDPTTDTLYAVGFYNEYTNGITVIDGADLAVTADFPVGLGACTHAAIDPSLHTLYLTCAQPGIRGAGITDVDTLTDTVTGTPLITPGPNLTAVADNATTHVLYAGTPLRPCSSRCPPGAQPPRYHHRVGR